MLILCYSFLKVANVVASNCYASYWHLLPPDISLGIVQLEEIAKLKFLSFHFTSMRKFLIEVQENECQISQEL